MKPWATEVSEIELRQELVNFLALTQRQILAAAAAHLKSDQHDEAYVWDAEVTCLIADIAFGLARAEARESGLSPYESYCIAIEKHHEAVKALRPTRDRLAALRRQAQEITE